MREKRKCSLGLVGLLVSLAGLLIVLPYAVSRSSAPVVLVNVAAYWLIIGGVVGLVGVILRRSIVPGLTAVLCLVAMAWVAVR